MQSYPKNPLIVQLIVQAIQSMFAPRQAPVNPVEQQLSESRGRMIADDERESLFRRHIEHSLRREHARNVPFYIMPPEWPLTLDVPQENLQRRLNGGFEKDM